ncbi:MAG: HD domain-containing protein [Clostridia bacterium]|nr:HD domain-containing protein [Clostridia bacterium]
MELDENKIDNALRFYMQAHKLKTVIRSGWKVWQIDIDRAESIAEHIYGTMMLAIAIHSEFRQDIDIDKVIKMLAIHEMEEIRIGDITPFDKVTDEEKREMGKVAVKKLCDNIDLGFNYIDVIEEFENQITPESKFARMIDKLEANIQSKIYDEQNAFDITKEEVKDVISDERIKGYMDDGLNHVSEFFVRNDQNKYDYMFKEISNYMLKQNLLNLGKILD